MWIRSQDKRRLVKVDNIVISGDDRIITFNREGIVDLGYYSTMERIYEVLDEIQEFERNIEISRLYFSSGEQCPAILIETTYQMPEE